MVGIARSFAFTKSYAIADTAGSTGSDVIDMEHLAGGSLQVTSTGLSSVTWYGTNSTDNTYGLLKSSTGGSVSAAAVTQHSPIDFPTEAYGVRFVKAVGSTGTSGTATVWLKG